MAHIELTEFLQLTRDAQELRPWGHWPKPLMGAMDALWRALDLEGQATGLTKFALMGCGARVPSPLPIASAMALAMAAATTAATAYGRLRGIAPQGAHLTLQTALAHVHAEHMFGPTLNGRPLASRMVRDNPLLATPYRCGDAAWIMPSALHPQQLLAWLRFLRVPPDVAAVAAAIGSWDGVALEEAAATAGLAAAVCRTRQQWRTHPQGRMLSRTPLMVRRTLNQVGPTPPKPGARPLEGVRVLALTQGVAGPIACRTLAEQGADVLHLAHPEGFEHEAVWCEGYVGCRSMGLNVADPQQARHMQALLRQCDGVLVSLRPRAQRALGLDSATLQKQHPGVVQVRLSAYGAQGPWASRPGFDMNAMAATGMMLEEAAHDGSPVPRLPPTVLLNDFLMGYLAAAGTCAALHQRARDGAVSEVQLNLARVAMWCQDLTLAGAEDSLEASTELLRVTEGHTPMGLLRRLAPGVALTGTPGAWRAPWLTPRGALAPQSAWPCLGS